LGAHPVNLAVLACILIRWTSPRTTQRLHQGGDIACFAHVVLVLHEAPRLGCKSAASALRSAVSVIACHAASARLKPRRLAIRLRIELRVGWFARPTAVCVAGEQANLSRLLGYFRGHGAL